MTLAWEWVLAALGAGATVATAIFQGAFYLGKVWSRLDQHDLQIVELQTNVDHLREQCRHAD